MKSIIPLVSTTFHSSTHLYTFDGAHHHPRLFPPSSDLTALDEYKFTTFPMTAAVMALVTLDRNSELLVSSSARSSYVHSNTTVSSVAV